MTFCVMRPHERVVEFEGESTHSEFLEISLHFLKEALHLPKFFQTSSGFRGAVDNRVFK